MEDNVFVNNNEHALTYNVDVCDKLYCIIEEFNVFYLQHRSSVPLDIFSNVERSLISHYSHIFLNYTPEKAILVKWIFDEIHKSFRQNNYQILKVEGVYTHVDSYFNETFEHDCLKQWFKDNELTYGQFLQTAEGPLSEYCRITGEQTYYSRSNNGGYIEWESPFEKRLDSMIQAINYANKSARLQPLFLVYNRKPRVRQQLNKFFSNIEIVSEMSSEYLSGINTREYFLFEDFIGWLRQDLKAMLYEELKKTFKDDRERELLIARAKGMTLEMAGTVILTVS